MEEDFRDGWKDLKAEKDLFSGVEGGKELYKMLCQIFQVDESEKD